VVMRGLVFGTSIASLEALFQAAGGVSSAGWQPRKRQPARRADRDALPLAVARGFAATNFSIAWWLAHVVMAGGLYVSTSRSGGLGALAGCLALVVFAFGRTRWVGVSVLGTGAIVAQPCGRSFSAPGQVSTTIRRAACCCGPTTLRMIADATAHRVGLRMPPGSRSVAISVRTGAPGVTYDRTHSGLLETLATQGIIGLAALAWFSSRCSAASGDTDSPFGGCARGGLHRLHGLGRVQLRLGAGDRGVLAARRYQPLVRGCALPRPISTDPAVAASSSSGGFGRFLAVIMAGWLPSGLA